MIKMIDRIKACMDRRRRERDLGILNATIIHRIRLSGLQSHPIGDNELDAELLCQAFQKHPELMGVTGRENPYHVVASPFGRLEQAIELADWGHHSGWDWNRHTVSVACIGDFRFWRPRVEQWDAVAELCALLQAWGCPPLGHSEVATKECPGYKWDMDLFREEVNAHPLSKLLPFEAEQKLIEVGVVF